MDKQQTPDQSKCLACTGYGEVEGGDLVEYWGAMIRTPSCCGCIKELDMDEDGELIDTSDCPEYEPPPICPRHSCPLDPKCGCEECMSEAYDIDLTIEGGEDNVS